MAPRITIIIPTLNEAPAIEATLLLLQPLRACGHEVILADGGSSDDTRRVAMPLVDRLVASERGRGTQMAAGAAAARHEVLWFLHADTLVPAGAGEAILGALQQKKWGRFNVRLSGRRWSLRLVERMMNWRSCWSGIATGDQGIFLTRDAYNAIGGMPRQPLMEDVELSKRLKRLGEPACLRTTLVTSSRRWEERGVVRTILLMWSLRAAYFLGVDAAQIARWYR